MDILKFIYIILASILFSPNSFSQKIVAEENNGDLDASHEKTQVSYSSQTPAKIRDIYFDSGEIDFSEEVKIKLNHLVRILNEDLIFEVLIVTHTDSKGTKAYNMDLSEKRANKIKAYLVHEGVAENRIYNEAFGEEKLKNHCVDGVICDEYLHKENRRAEFVLFKD